MEYIVCQGDLQVNALPVRLKGTVSRPREFQRPYSFR